MRVTRCAWKALSAAAVSTASRSSPGGSTSSSGATGSTGTASSRRRRAGPVHAGLARAPPLGENVRSVSYRYTDVRPNELPGPVAAPWLGEYTARTTDLNFAIRTGRIRLADIVSAVACYRYQSCEHPEWHDSVAAAFCEELEAEALRVYAHRQE